MNYDVEREKQKSEEIRKAFRELFPLAAEEDLPWSPIHIKGFLRDRIEREVREGVHHFTSRVCRVLCEISPPKTHVEDMARIVVTEAVDARRLRSEVTRLKEAAQDLDRLRKIVGCVVRNLDRATDGNRGPDADPPVLSGVTWGKVAYFCGLGSTSANDLCREFGVDPNHDADCDPVPAPSGVPMKNQTKASDKCQEA